MLSIELSRLFNWAVMPAADAETLFEEPELNDVMRWANAQPLARQQELLSALPVSLPTLDPIKASALLVFGGGLVENGADPDTLLPAGVQHLRRLWELHTLEEKLPKAAWRFAVIGLMAMLCRSATGRALWRQQTDLLAWLQAHEDLSGHFFYLLRMAETSDEEVLWLVFPAYETGLEIEISQVNNGFQLLTLVQPLVREQAAALRLRHPPTATDEQLLRYTQGDASAEELTVEQDFARLNWLNALAYEGGPLNPLQLVWGDAPVSSLPRVRGRVVLLATDDEARLQRSWDLGFLAPLHDANRPAVRLRRRLAPAEVQALLAEMHAPVKAVPAPMSPAPAPKRSFWQRLKGK